MLPYLLKIDNKEYPLLDLNLVFLIIFNSFDLIIKYFEEINYEKLPEISLKKFNNFGSFEEYSFDYNKFKFKNLYLTQELDKLLSNYKNKINIIIEDKKIIDEKELLMAKINALENKKKNIEKQKEEKQKEISRTFEVDYEIFTNNKKLFEKEVPEIFKYKYEVFKEMNNLDNKEECKDYYFKNVDRIFKNIGSTKFSGIFNQIEKEEN